MNEFLTADEIEAAAKKRGLTIPMLCSEANVHHTTFYRWKTGECSPTIKVYQRICDALRRNKFNSAKVSEQ